MRCRSVLIIILLFLLACSQTQCKKDIDCSAKAKNAFIAQCTASTCSYTPIPNVCGNEKCDGTENKCTCASDCGQCSGPVIGSQYLVSHCANNQCVESAPTKPAFNTATLNNAGDAFSIDSIYDSPFNIKQATFGLTISLNPASQNHDHKIVRATLSGVTKEHRTITLSRTDINKPLWAGEPLPLELILTYPGTEFDSELSELTVQLDYDYLAGKTKRVATIKTTFKEKLIFVNPTTPAQCPPCDDKNLATADTCGPQTNFFCVHNPLPNMCGNYQCEIGETSCNCPKDCGHCSGSTTFLEFGCVGDTCAAQLKKDLTSQPVSIFDDRSLGPIQLQNNYHFSNPLDITHDKIALDFTLYRVDPTVSGVTIETVRLLEGQEQLAQVNVNHELSDKPSSVFIPITSNLPEEEHQVTLAIWYHYTQDGKEKTGSFQKPLGKITLLSPHE